MKNSSMKGSDLARICFHNIRHNTSRTLLTIVIVAVVSTLIMSVFTIGFNFANNITDAGIKLLESEGAYFTIGGTKTRVSDVPITLEERIEFDKIFQRYPTVADRKEYILFNTAQYSLQSFSDIPTFRIHYNLPETMQTSVEEYLSEHPYNFLINKIDFRDVTVADLSCYSFGGNEQMVEGRLWNAQDNDKPFIWLSDKLVQSLQKKGTEIKTGDTVTFASLYEDTSLSDPETARLLTCTVQGIYKADSLVTSVKKPFYLNHLESQMIVGKNFLDVYQDKALLMDIYLDYSLPQSDYNYNEIYNTMVGFRDEVAQLLPPFYGPLGITSRVYSSHISYMEMAQFSKTLLLSVFSALCLLILLLCVGSVVNTILISVDKNKKFFGLLKALGLLQKDLKIIVGLEVLLNVLLGVALSVAMILPLQQPMFSIIDTIFNRLFYQAPPDFVLTMVFPWWLPIVNAVIFAAIAVLDTLRNVKTFAEKNVISTISEVE